MMIATIIISNLIVNTIVPIQKKVWSSFIFNSCPATEWAVLRSFRDVGHLGSPQEIEVPWGALKPLKLICGIIFWLQLVPPVVPGGTHEYPWNSCPKNKALRPGVPGVWRLCLGSSFTLAKQGEDLWTIFFWVALIFNGVYTNYKNYMHIIRISIYINYIYIHVHIH